MCVNRTKKEQKYRRTLPCTLLKLTNFINQFHLEMLIKKMNIIRTSNLEEYNQMI